MAKLTKYYEAEWDPEDGTAVARFKVTPPELSDRLIIEQLFTEPRTAKMDEKSIRVYIDQAVKHTASWTGVTEDTDEAKPLVCDEANKQAFFSMYYPAVIEVLSAHVLRGQKKVSPPSTPGSDSNISTEKSTVETSPTDEEATGGVIG